jgi:Leucine-rich repeat (LRR) protein
MISVGQTDAFRDARIRELYMVDCGLQEISPSAFSGLEASLQLLDLSGNNLTNLPPHLLQVGITLL